MRNLLEIETELLSDPILVDGLQLDRIRTIQTAIRSQQRSKFRKQLGLAKIMKDVKEYFDLPSTQEIFSNSGVTWSDASSLGTDTNTTYDLSVPVSTTKIRLAGSDSTNDDVEIFGGTNVTVTRTDANKLTISSVFDGENLEQLKPLYNGLKIRVGEASKRPGPSVDVFEDVRLVEEELMK